MNNTWKAKLYRTLTCLLPVAQNRTGQCIRCGKCCELPNKCPWLSTGDDGKTKCVIHSIRPMNCRKYPRTEKEHITTDTCGFRFEKKS